MTHLEKEVEEATISYSTGSLVSLSSEEKDVESSHFIASRGLTLTSFERATKDWRWGREIANSQKQKQV